MSKAILQAGVLMWISSWIASLHFLAVAIGFGSVFMRGRYFKALADSPDDDGNLRRLLIADNFWGIAAVLWLISGLLRAFGGLEKGSDFYLHNVFFYMKIALFAVVLMIEIPIMVTLIKVRLNKLTQPQIPVPVATLKHFRRMNHFEALLILIILFVASAMARGLWMMNNA
jgi:putative membrane protein